jgi:tetratricopeptide (TPR) repeat protein
MFQRSAALALWFAITVTLAGLGQSGGSPINQGKQKSKALGDLELVERLLIARRDYQRTLEQLRTYYINNGDVERSTWAEEELRQFHRIPKYPYRLELIVPPPTLHATTNIPDANRLFTRAMQYKDKAGWNSTDYIDNQRRCELLLQQLLTLYPQSNKIGDAAYALGDIYESKANKFYRLAAVYFERCYQWNPTTQHDARMRAARLYDRQLLDRGKAIDIYKEVQTHETDHKRLEEAMQRLTVLTGSR